MNAMKTEGSTLAPLDTLISVDDTDVDFEVDIEDGDDKLSFDQFLDPIPFQRNSTSGSSLSNVKEVENTLLGKDNLKLDKDQTQNIKPVVVKGPSRRADKKRPKGMPKRPLSAYNLFFQQERIKLYQESTVGRISFEVLGKEIGLRWRKLGDKDRVIYDQLAEKEVERYRKERDAFEQARRKKADSSTSEEKGNVTTSSCSSPLPIMNFAPYQVHSNFRPRLMGPISCPPVLLASRNSSGISVSNSSTPPPVVSGIGGYHPRAAESSVDSFPDNHSLSRAMVVPPGMEVVLPDPADGTERVYKVQYTCYRMTSSEADRYMQRLLQSSQDQQPHMPSGGSHVRHASSVSSCQGF